MSHGLGSRERSVLRTLDRFPGKWVRVTVKCRDRAEASALRRAVHSLERRGLVEAERRCVRGRSCLVVRRAAGPARKIIPDDVAGLLSPEERTAMAGDYAAVGAGRWDEHVERVREHLRGELYRLAVASGLSLKDVRDVLMLERLQRDVNAARGWSREKDPGSGTAPGRV